MPLELATRLILRSPEDGSPLAQERLRAIVASWAGVAEAATDELSDAAAPNGGLVSTREVELNGRTRWDLALTRPDNDDQSVSWRAEVTGVFDPDRTTFVARLRRDSTDHRLRPLTGSPAPPRFIRDVLGALDVDCFDGPMRVEARYRELSKREVAQFVESTLPADDRRLPVLAVAKLPPGPDRRVDVNVLTRVLAGFAHVVLVDRNALPELGREAGQLSLAPASARLWWPGLSLDDDSTTHPHWQGPFQDPAAVVEAVRRLVLSVSRDRWREPSRVVEFTRALRRRREVMGQEAANRVIDELQTLREAAAAQRAQAHDAQDQDAKRTAAIVEYEGQLDKMSADLGAMRDELESQRVAVEDAENAWAEAEEQRERLEQQNRALQGQVEGLKAQLQARPGAVEGPQTDEEVFARDIERSWEARLTANDRETHPLCEFVVRDGFLASITAVGADRQKVVDTAMEVACGRAKEIDGRQLHKLRSGTGGNAPEKRRKNDGAVAWRCNIQTKSASARRLHYWVCDGGSVEFVSVVIHDDFSIVD